MKLVELMHGVASVESAVTITGLTLDSRQVQPGFAFIAVNGSTRHGLIHAKQAIEKGAAAIIFDPSGEGAERAAALDFPLAVSVPQLSTHLGRLAATFYGYPSDYLRIIGITGTNGKTTCCHLLGQILPACGIVGTLGWGQHARMEKTINTTPDAISVQKILRHFVDSQDTYAVMEVSSHGLQQERVNAVRFSGAVFTNLSRDHLDYHATMSEYLDAKMRLLTRPELDYVVVNMADAHVASITKRLSGQVKIWGFGASVSCRADEYVHADNVRYDLQGITFDVRWRGRTARISAPLLGCFNLDNLLAVISVLLAEGMDLQQLPELFVNIEPVPGRIERLGGIDTPTVIVDYAHTPDALEKLLSSLRYLTDGKISVVFGCGGDRDKGKRPLMGAVAARWANNIIVTNDNPRMENPEQIVNDIKAGLKGDTAVKVVLDRGQAIQDAISEAHPQECIVIAGKGHEEFQDIQGQSLPFSDKSAAHHALRQWSKKCA